MARVVHSFATLWPALLWAYVAYIGACAEDGGALSRAAAVSKELLSGGAAGRRRVFEDGMPVYITKTDKGYVAMPKIQDYDRAYRPDAGDEFVNNYNADIGHAVEPDEMFIEQIPVAPFALPEAVPEAAPEAVPEAAAADAVPDAAAEADAAEMPEVKSDDVADAAAASVEATDALPAASDEGGGGIGVAAASAGILLAAGGTVILGHRYWSKRTSKPMASDSAEFDSSGNHAESGGGGGSGGKSIVRWLFGPRSPNNVQDEHPSYERGLSQEYDSSNFDGDDDVQFTTDSDDDDLSSSGAAERHAKSASSAVRSKAGRGGPKYSAARTSAQGSDGSDKPGQHDSSQRHNQGASSGQRKTHLSGNSGTSSNKLFTASQNELMSGGWQPLSRASSGARISTPRRDRNFAVSKDKSPHKTTTSTPRQDDGVEDLFAMP